MHPVAVSDSLSNTNEHIEEAARAIGRSATNRRVFSEIYNGKQRIKTVQEIADATGLTRKQVLTAGNRLADGIVEQVKHNRDTAYRKLDFFHARKGRILALAGNRAKLDALPTKRKAALRLETVILPTRGADTRVITVDDIDSFKKVCKIETEGNLPSHVSENAFKRGIRSILKDGSNSKDWGGEKNDVHTTRLRVDGKRRIAAFAFKGPGKTGKLVPGKMGKNGDQIQRLFQSTAQAFFVQYWADIDESVLDQMKPLAVAKSLSDGNRIWYGVIDGQDSNRIYTAYHRHFKK